MNFTAQNRRSRMALMVLRPVGVVLVLFVFGSLAFRATPQVFAQSSTTSVIHVVSWGETLWAIAAQYNVSVDAVLRANGLLDGDHIYAGQRLVIPDGSGSDLSNSSGLIHVVQPGENLYRISLGYGVSTSALAAVNGLESPDEVYVGQTLVVPSSSERAVSSPASPTSVADSAGSHVVRSGETLSAIGQLYGVSVAALATANNLLNPSQIYAGQRLTIPGAASATVSGYSPEEASTTHQVRAGETLSSIAAAYSVNFWSIVQANSISNPSLVYRGQILVIPLSTSPIPNVTSGTTNTSRKSIVVDVSEQMTYAYQDGAVVGAFVVSTGIPGRDTWRGQFEIQNKIPMAYASTWDLQMPYWMGFYWAGSLQNGFHALPILSSGIRLWEGLLGQPASYGCVILSDADARWLYEWAEIGTSVIVQN